MTAFFTSCIYIHSQNASLWKEFSQLIVGLLSSCSIVTNTATLTVWTDMRNFLRKSTIMAVHGFSIHVQSKRNIAVRTGVNSPTFPTHNKARITTAVEHENHLLFFIQSILYCLNQRWCKIRCFILPDIITEVNQLNFRNTC